MNKFYKNNHPLVVVGSRAAKHWFSHYREPQDWDFLWEGPNQFINGEIREEYHNIDELKGNRIIYDWTLQTGQSYAAPELLYTLKLATIYFIPNHFEKTAYDLRFFQHEGVKYNEELFKVLYADFEAYHGKKKAKLNKPNAEFFKDAVQRQYEHDDIHRAIAYYNEPLYERLKTDKNSAYCSEKLFDKLSFDDKIKLCCEEISVIALERFLIPKDFAMNKVAAWRMAIKQLLTTMTKGWFPKFIAMNLDILWKPDDNHNFVTLFKEKMYAGKS